MKRIHKLISILAALAVALTMCVGMAGTVSADAATGHTITINPSKDSTEVHTYEAYQIFSGTYSKEKGTLTDINWGTGVNGDALLQLLAKNDTFKKAKTASEVADILSASTNPEDAETFAQRAAACLDKVAGKAVADAANKTAVISGLSDGYYLIRDVSENLTADTFSKYILKVAGDVTVNAKSSSTTSYKKVKDINDSNAKGMTDWQDAADWDIGYEVPFELVGQVAPDYGEYSTYAFVFHDVESQGLTFNKDSVKVYIDEATEPIAGGYTVETNPTDHCTFEIRFDNLKQVQDVMANSVIRVEYTATLNENAVIGSAGNPNTSHVEFSNNPYDSTKKGNTSDDKVIVFTYETIVNKVDPDRKPLQGAAFTLLKKVSDGTYTTVKTIAAGDTTKFEFKGLDDGDYRLSETTAPEGYNKIQDIDFTISASHDENSANPALLKLMGTSDNGATVNLGIYKATVSPNNGTITTDIVNKKGTLLPSTGGIGTRIFYAAGAILVAAAIALLVYRKKMAGRA